MPAITLPIITLFVTRADNGVIGHQGGRPWQIEKQAFWLARLTEEMPLIMGRRTFESADRPLADRPAIVLTRNRDWVANGARVAHSAEQALALASEAPDVAIIGGAEIFAMFLPQARRIELTELHRSPEGDLKMPPIGSGWRVSERILSGPDFDFVTLVR